MEKKLTANNVVLEVANKAYGNAEDSINGRDAEMDDAAKSEDDMGEEIEDTGDAAEKSESKFSGIGTVLKTVGAAMGAMVISTGAAAVEFGKEGVSAYADYDQLVGSVWIRFLRKIPRNCRPMPPTHTRRRGFRQTTIWKPSHRSWLP